MPLKRGDSHSRASLVWIFVSAIPLQIGSIAAMLYVLSSINDNKAYSLLFLIPFMGPIVAYVLTSTKDEYISSMAGWIFLGQILSSIILEILIVSL